MTIYLCCNDNYFSGGAIALLESNEIMAVPIDKNDRLNLLNANDVIILESECNLTIREFVIQATIAGATFLLVLDTPCHIKSPTTWNHSHFSKKINKDLLVKLIRYIEVQYNDIDEELTLCELEIMELLINGKKPDGIALDLGIPLKNILEYKKTSLIKMGLKNDNSLYLIHFKKLTLARYYSMNRNDS